MVGIVGSDIGGDGVAGVISRRRRWSALGLHGASAGTAYLASQRHGDGIAPAALVDLPGGWCLLDEPFRVAGVLHGLDAVPPDEWGRRIDEEGLHDLSGLVAECPNERRPPEGISTVADRELPLRSGDLCHADHEGDDRLRSRVRAIATVGVAHSGVAKVCEERGEGSARQRAQKGFGLFRRAVSVLVQESADVAGAPLHVEGLAHCYCDLFVAQSLRPERSREESVHLGLVGEQLYCHTLEFLTVALTKRFGFDMVVRELVQCRDDRMPLTQYEMNDLY